ncbi:MAG: hypothetical protein AAF290_16405 [Pseudomonadota bacterium]
MRLSTESTNSLPAAFAVALIYLSMVIPLPAHAETGPWTTITQIYSRTGTGRPFIYLASGAMPGCHNDRGGYLGNEDPEHAKATYSTLLAALLADREVQIFYTITGVPSGWSMCTITAVYIR